MGQDFISGIVSRGPKSALPDTSQIQLGSAESLLIGQHEIGFTNAACGIPILASCGAGPCVIMAAYNPETKEVGLTHIDNAVDDRAIMGLIHNVTGSSRGGIEIHLVGGSQMGGQETADKIKRLIANCYGVTLKTDDTGTDAKSDRLAIDARTGEIYTAFSTNKIKEATPYNPMTAMMITSRHTSLNNAFDGRKLKGQKAHLWLGLKHAAIPLPPDVPSTSQYTKIMGLLMSDEVELPRDKIRLETEIRALADLASKTDAPKIRELVSNFGIAH